MCSETRPNAKPKPLLVIAKKRKYKKKDGPLILIIFSFILIVGNIIKTDYSTVILVTSFVEFALNYRDVFYYPKTKKRKLIQLN